MSVEAAEYPRPRLDFVGGLRNSAHQQQQRPEHAAPIEMPQQAGRG